MVELEAYDDIGLSPPMRVGLQYSDVVRRWQSRRSGWLSYGREVFQVYRVVVLNDAVPDDERSVVRYGPIVGGLASKRLNRRGFRAGVCRNVAGNRPDCSVISTSGRHQPSHVGAALVR